MKFFEYAFGCKKAYFSSLKAICMSVLWSVPFFLIAQLAVSLCFLPIITDLFTPVHLFFKSLMGEGYSRILEEQYFFAASAVIALLAGCKYGFKGAAERRAHFTKFTDGFATSRQGFAHHYKCYGALDFVLCAIVTLFLSLAKKYAADILLLVPHFNVLSPFFPLVSQNAFLEFLCATLVMSLASIYGVFVSQKLWCADLLYDLE